MPRRCPTVNGPSVWRVAGDCGTCQTAIMALKLRLDLGLGDQPMKLAALIIIVWAGLCFAVLHDRLGGPWDAEMRDMLILLAVPPVVVLGLTALLRWLGGGRA